MDLVLHPISDKNLKTVVKKLPQSLIIVSDPGYGLDDVSAYIANQRKAELILVLPEKDNKVDLDGGIINIDIIRRLNSQTRTKGNVERIIVINFAERMTHQAQNAFLKLLEEPGDGVYFILLSESTTNFLPTIMSRAEILDIKPLTDMQSEDLLEKNLITDNTKRLQLLFMANGLPKELIKLSNDELYFEKRSQIIRDARDFLTANLYHKLLIAQNYKDDRSSALQLLLDCTKILKRSINDNPKIENINQLDKILSVYDLIQANGNVRLCLAKLAI